MPMDMQQLWKLIEDARRQVLDPGDGEQDAGRATAFLSAYPREEIVAAGEVLRELMAKSYQIPLWAAAYVVNGGCSDDGFDYFRGWLIGQGREVFEHVVADPDEVHNLTGDPAHKQTLHQLRSQVDGFVKENDQQVAYEDPLDIYRGYWGHLPE